MGIVFPSEAIARRWNGALQARLCRAPLEEFLKRRGITPALAGISQHSDNLVRATILLVEPGIALHFADHAGDLAAPQREFIGHATCWVNRVLANLISQPGAWRIGTLVSTACLLSPWIGLNAAALAAASSVRQFQREGSQAASPMDALLSDTVLAAVAHNAPAAMAELSATIVARLRSPTELESACSAGALLEVQSSDHYASSYIGLRD